MKLTLEQRKKVEENMGLVGKVIADKVHDVNSLGFYSYDDIFQIGCIGLCKAAATDKGGCFSTYAYRLIWNAICDELIYSSRRQKSRYECEDERIDSIRVSGKQVSNDSVELRQDLYSALRQAERDANSSVVKGIKALLLMNKGYTAREIGEKLGAAPNLITAYISKAKKYLKTRPELASLAEYGDAV